LSRYVVALSRVMTLADVSALTGLGWDTVKEIVRQRLQHDYGQPRLKDLKSLAMDEIYVGKRKKFYTLVLDLETGQIVWVGHGRGQAALGKFWRRRRLSKAKIQAVAMEMSGAYWAAVLEHLPGVAVVFDRFHLIKLLNEKLDELRRALVREATGAMRQTIKGTRYLLLTRAAHLAEGQLPKLEEALKLNEPLSQAYYLKEELSLLWEQSSRAAMENFLRQWCTRAMATGIGLLRQMAKTLLLHAGGILHWWEHRISTGKMEGVNNKLKTLTRRAYGDRDEAFFILKLLSLHQAKFKLGG
jgi:transposase